MRRNLKTVIWIHQNTLNFITFNFMIWTIEEKVSRGRVGLKTSVKV